MSNPKPSRISASLPGRRNLPRASHACQRCRAKKAKCDQRQPCGNCTKNLHECTYGIRRINARDRGNLGTNADGRLPHRGAPTLSPHPPPPPPPRGDADESLRRRSEDPGSDQPRQSDRPVLARQSSAVENPDVLGDVNQHTQGIEFYGTSSTFVLLNQFFAYARQHPPPDHAVSSIDHGAPGLSPASGGATELNNSAWTSDSGASLTTGKLLSIVNLLSDKEPLEPDSRSSTPPNVTKHRQALLTNSRLAPIHPSPASSSRQEHSVCPVEVESNRGNTDNLYSSTHPATTERPILDVSFRASKERVEREFIRQFLNNLHHLHPMLDSTGFIRRCEEEVWSPHDSIGEKRELRHFFALHNIVVAVGALVAGSSIAHDFERDIRICMGRPERPEASELSLLNQELSKEYFRRSKALLGDVFEVCSLESAQTLLLMSLYCQNSLKPHACYMYCGHAVRTALAIGIERESLSRSLEYRKAARRTWWCIYSHEIDMSCSAGRRDSLGKPRNYQIDLPHIKSQAMTLTNGPSDTETPSVAMINEMVHFAAILRRISKELYHDSKGLTLLQRSGVARELESLLEDWKAHLPDHLSFDRVSFREEEWATKQKLVLRLRYLNAKFVLHRPFIEAPARSINAPLSWHVESCLEAARGTIRVMFDAYTNRPYFRTWWYNSTYTLYAGMMVLYIVMLGHTSVPSDELLGDALKAQDILQSMEEAVVARRSASLIHEAYQVARAFVQGQREQSVQPSRDSVQENHQPWDTSDPNGNANQTMTDLSKTLFSFGVPGQDEGLLASMIDPNLLQDFTASGLDTSGLEFLTLPFENPVPDEADADPMSMNL